MKRLLAASLLLVVPSALAEVQNTSFRSQALERDVSVSVQLPPAYASSPKRRFPVVYALHGLFESAAFWEGRGLAAILERLWQDGSLPQFILVAVDGGNSFFINGPGGRFEDMVAQDATAWVEASYRAVPGREGRGLWGVSMGGYAALRIALARPEAFYAVATHSAMLLETPPRREDGAGRWQMDALHRAFGDPIDAALWAANDPLALALGLDPRRAPAVRFDCGAEDRYSLQLGNAALHRRLEARGVRHEFELPPGDHGYEYVLSVAEKSLRFLGSRLK